MANGNNCNTRVRCQKLLQWIVCLHFEYWEVHTLFAVFGILGDTKNQSKETMSIEILWTIPLLGQNCWAKLLCKKSNRYFWQKTSFRIAQNLNAAQFLECVAWQETNAEYRVHAFIIEWSFKKTFELKPWVMKASRYSRWKMGLKLEKCLDWVQFVALLGYQDSQYLKKLIIALGKNFRKVVNCLLRAWCSCYVETWVWKVRKTVDNCNFLAFFVYQITESLSKVDDK